MKRVLIIAIVILGSVFTAMYFDGGSSEGSEKLSKNVPAAGYAGVVESAPAGPVSKEINNHDTTDTVKKVLDSTDEMDPASDSSQQKPSPAPVQTETARTAPSPAPAPVKAPEAYPPLSENTSASSQQKEMLGYINTARAKANLAPLKLDGDLNQCAYMKSKDMAVNGYFSHYSPTYGSPFEMMTAMGIGYRTAGENIAKNFSVKGAFDAFMNSDGHRANILNGDFRKVGLGFYRDSNYLFVTQVFTD
ncbi:MAG: CAP domain-containing protein [Syntrophomonadaceae bacterium]